VKERIAIVDGVRTPFCRAGGAFSGVGSDDLGAIVVREVMARSGLGAGEIDEVIFGTVAQPADAMNVARVIALKAGLPESVIAHTVQRNCASGIQAITTAALQIAAGESEIVIAGGTESMSRYPLLYGPRMTGLFMRLMKARTMGSRLGALASFRPRFLKPIVALQHGLTDSVCCLKMGQMTEDRRQCFGRQIVAHPNPVDRFLAQLAHGYNAMFGEQGGHIDRFLETENEVVIAPECETATDE